jgi:hypothetical protein
MGGSVEVESQQGVGSEFIINVKTKCLVKKCFMADGSYRGNCTDPFIFIQKGCKEEEQTLFVENTIEQEDCVGQPEEVNIYGKAEVIVQKEFDKVEDQLEFIENYQLPENLLPEDEQI